MQTIDNVYVHSLVSRGEDLQTLIAFQFVNGLSLLVASSVAADIWLVYTCIGVYSVDFMHTILYIVLAATEDQRSFYV